jgi:protein kinase A
MAAAAIKNHLLPPSLQHHPSSRESSPQPPAASPGPHNDGQGQLDPSEQEKLSISQWEAHRGPLSPEQVLQDPAQKPVGHSSRSLQVHDFELLKTLGTGMAALCPQADARRTSADTLCE